MDGVASFSLEKVLVLRGGREVEVSVARALGNELIVSGNLVRRCSVRDEWYHEIADPVRLIECLAARPRFADVLTFIQRPPCEGGATLRYRAESENVAAIPLESYRHWWDHQIESKTRALVRKAAKNGVTVRRVEFDQEFLAGVEEIYNETPIRQGRRFWHYGKSREYLYRLHQTYIDRSDLLGAYCDGRLVGFVKLVYAGETANMMHIISLNSFRNRAVSNALVAKAVEWCCTKGCTLLVYDKYDYETGGGDSLLQFKRHNGFQKVEFPRYFVPLTPWGRLALHLGLHRGMTSLLPRTWVDRVLRLRRRWYSSMVMHEQKMG